MRKFLPALLLALAFISLPQPALADNGVERGEIDFAAGNPIPAYVRKFLDQLIFTSCDLDGASTIEPNFQTEIIEHTEIGLNAIRYRVELAVSYKHGRFKDYIFADVTGFTSEIGDTEVKLNELHSRICTTRKH